MLEIYLANMSPGDWRGKKGSRKTKGCIVLWMKENGDQIILFKGNRRVKDGSWVSVVSNYRYGNYKR